MRSAASERSERTNGHQRRRGVVAALVVALTLSAPALGSPAGAQPAEDEAGRLRLVSQTPWVRSGQSFDLTLAVEAVAQPSRADLEITVHASVSARSAFARTLDGDLGNPLVTTVRPLAGIVPDLTGARRVSLPVDDLGVRRQGVYPVRVALRTSTAGVVDELVTHLVRVPEPEADPDDRPVPLAVAWLQPFGADPALQPDGTVELDDAAEELRATAEVIGSSAAAISLEPTPETLDALSVTGDDEVLESLGGSVIRQQVLARPYVDVDVESLVRSGLAGDLEAQLQRGAGTLEANLGVTPGRATWSAEVPIGTEGLKVLRFLGVERVVLDEDELEELELNITPTAPFALDDGSEEPLPVLPVDSALSGHLRAGDDQVLAAHHLLADLAVLFFDLPGLEQRGVAVRPPEGEQPSAELLATVLAALEDSPILEPVTVDTLFDRVEQYRDDEGELVVRSLAEPVPAIDRIDSGAVRRARAAVASVENVVGPSDLSERLLLVAASVDLDPAERRAYRDAAAAGLASGLDGVGVLDRGAYRLTAQEGSIPLTLVAGAVTPLAVTLTLESVELDFLDGDDAQPGRFVQRLTLDRPNTPVPIRVRARTPGEFRLQATVTSRDGTVRISASTLTVRATAPSGVGIVLSAGAGLFLLLWWARHWRTARRARRLVARPVDRVDPVDPVAALDSSG